MSAALNIAALAQRTGVAPDTLRKWEQRYRILQPARTPGGQRRYSERDVARVEWLNERLREGYRIGEAATLLGGAEIAPARSAPDQLGAIVDSLARGGAADVGLRLDQAFALNGVDDTLESLICPLLRTVGERWSRGELTIAEEHLVSEAVRSRLGNLLADTGGGVRGTAVLACAPGERHELGLMMAAIALRRDGWEIVYLGTDLPPGEVLALARQLRARLAGFSVAMAEHAPALERALADAAQPDRTAVVIGGAAATPELAHRLGATHAGPGLGAAVETVRLLAA